MAWTDDAEDLLAKKQQDQEKVSDADKWDPKEGDILIGTMLEAKIVNTQFGDARIMIVEEAGTGKVYTVWVTAKMFLDAVLTAGPAQNKGVSIKFDGKKQPKTAGGREYKAYYFECEESDFKYWKDVSDAYYQKQQDNSPVGGGGSQTQLEDPFT